MADYDPTEHGTDVPLLFKLWRDGEIKLTNKRQDALLNFWKAWLEESNGDFEQDCITVPDLLHELWKLSS